MLRSTVKTKLQRIPQVDRNDPDSLLPGNRSRLRGPLRTDGFANSPDVFDIRERVPEEFAADESPQAEGKRARAIEERIASYYPGFERVDDDTDGDTTKATDNED